MIMIWCKIYQKNGMRGMGAVKFASKSEGKHLDNDNVLKDLHPYPLYFIMHVGPLKTATTTMQCELQHYRKYNLLPSDVDLAETNSCKPPGHSAGNGQIASERIHECFKEWAADVVGMPDCWENEFMPHVEKQKEQNKSIIVSEEILSQINWAIGFNNHQNFVNDLQASLRQQGYQLWIIIGYRYFAEWAHSFYTQAFKFSPDPKLVRDYEHWPDEGGWKVPTFESYANSQLNRNFFTDRVVEFYTLTNVTIKVIDTDQGDIMKQFLCDSLPQSLANSMCELSQSIRSNYHNESPNYLWCDVLAIKAHEKGLIHQTNDKTRRQIIKDMLKYSKESKMSYEANAPKLCPDQSFYDALHNESMEHYYNVFGDEQLENKKIEYEKRLNHAKDSDKFCTVDAEKMLLEKDWINFFKRYS